MGIIKLKRGNNINFAGITLEAGEPAFVLDNGKFYIGNGTDKILINPDNVPTATKLLTSRVIGLTGDGSGSASFDGTENASISLVLANTGVAQGTYTKVTVDTKGRITSATTLSVSDIPDLTLSKITDAGTAASKNTGTAVGNVPVLGVGGKLDSAVLPAIAISDTFVVATEALMLALSTAEVGDVAVRTDINKSFILKTSGPATLANWQELLTPTVTSTANLLDSTDKRFMTDAQETKLDAITGTNTGDETVTTIKTKLGITTLSGSNTGDETVSTIKTKLGITTLSGSNTGDQDLSGLALKTITVNGHPLNANVTVSKSDVGLSAVDNTADASKPVSTAQQTAINLKANIASPAFTGTPTAPTAAVGTNTLQVATTAFVKAQGFIDQTGTVDGGTF